MGVGWNPLSQVVAGLANHHLRVNKTMISELLGPTEVMN